MKYFKVCSKFVLACSVTAVLMPLIIRAAEIPDPRTYIPTAAQIDKYKKVFDDPRPLLKEFGLKQVLPKELYDKLTYDEEKMKSLWTEVVGFRAPDVVGKIAPEIKPGKYTYKDLNQYPGFKQLMWPLMYQRIKPGGPPHVGNIPEFEIIPTRQYYFALPIAGKTKMNEAKTKLDKNGYLIPESWEGGYPFPKPSEPFKAQQIVYNHEKRCMSWEMNQIEIGRSPGFTKNLKVDAVVLWFAQSLKLAGRSIMPPYGWFDERATKQGEFRAATLGFLAPRDIANMVQLSLFYLDPAKGDSNMIYIPSFRRARKMTSTDTQDAVSGQDLTYDDLYGLFQKLSPTVYPYKYEVLEEREYLVISPSVDGSEYLTSSGGRELRNVKMERRPLYVVKMTQLDPNYIYSYRILYIDKETFMLYRVENYDQKKRLYRTWETQYAWHPEMGMFSWCGGWLLAQDHVDLHSSMSMIYSVPAFWKREDISFWGMEGWAK